MKLKLACADFSFPLLPHDNVLDLIAMLGIEGVDIGLFADRSHIQPNDVFKNIPRAARELYLKLEDRGLVAADIFLQPGASFDILAANDPDPKVRRLSRDSFQQALEYAVRCNARHFSALPGVDWKQQSHEDSLKRCAEELAWRVEQASAVGVVFSVEAHIGSLVPTPEDAMELLKMTKGLTLTLDYGHFAYVGIPDERVEPLVEHASHFHARGGCKGRLQSSLKENTIDFPRILGKMKQTKYPGYVGVEYVWIDWERCNEVDNLCETILLRDLLKKVKL